MPLVFKVDVLQALKSKGYNTNTLRKDKLLSESTIQKLRERKPISWANISQLCGLLDCQPGDILKYEADVPQVQETEESYEEHLKNDPRYQTLRLKVTTEKQEPRTLRLKVITEKREPLKVPITYYTDENGNKCMRVGSAFDEKGPFDEQEPKPVPTKFVRTKPDEVPPNEG